MSIETGGLAFPLNEKEGDGTHYYSHGGMTLRDYFAAKAMAAAVSGMAARGEPLNYRECALFAYEQADAMLAARGAE